MQTNLQFVIDEPMVDCRALGVAHAAVIHGNAVLEDRLQGIAEVLCVPPGQRVDDGGVCAACRGHMETGFGCRGHMETGFGCPAGKWGR